MHARLETQRNGRWDAQFGSADVVGGMEDAAALDLVEHAMGVVPWGRALGRVVTQGVWGRVGRGFPDQGEGREDGDFLHRDRLGNQYGMEPFLEEAGALAIVVGHLTLDAQLLGDVGPVGFKAHTEDKSAASMQQNRQRSRYEQELPQGF